MKPIPIILLFFTVQLALSTAAQQSGVDSTGVPGDHFSLQGALEMFKKAASPEEFEKLINLEDNHVNNLDLNGDGKVDYVRVIDKMEKDVHAFVLQVAVSEKESQDIAVIELEKSGEANAVLQIVGDEDIYGEQVIIEPGAELAAADFDFDPNQSIASGPNSDVTVRQTAPIVINVWFWPSVRFVYAPRYVGWRSPWKWAYYPGWWRPRKPWGWSIFHPRAARYHRSFVVVHTHRVLHAHQLYRPGRVHSPSVRARHNASVNHYRVTRTKTTVTGPRGNKVTRHSTTVRGRGGNKVKSTHTSVKKRR